MTNHDWQEEYDWIEAFEYADFSIQDVDEVIYMEEGENDGASWIMFGKLDDGMFFFLTAGCDYTGWDCQAGGSSYVSRDKNKIIYNGMGVEDRRRFGLPSAEDSP